MTPFERIDAARAELRLAQKELVAHLAQDKSRKRGQVIRQLHDLRHMLETGCPYVSQAGQDVVIDRFFKHKTGGTFVDVGGYDGVTGSNTLFLEQIRGWTGVLVEPVPAQLAKARTARRCPCLPYAVAETDGVADFIEVTQGYTQMSGLSGSYDDGLLAQVRQDPRHKEDVIKVQTRTLSAILTESGIDHPDFISLDIEGGETAALRSFPFDRHRVGAWAIENNTGTPEIANIMVAHGYGLVEFCGPDEIYIKQVR